jgi:uncharacterized repeat protein (TIGR01451 family)
MRRFLAAALGVTMLIGLFPSAASAALSATPDLTWGTNGKVNAILRVGNTIYLGGDFTALQDTVTDVTVPRAYIGAIDAITGEPTSFAPSLNGSVFAFAASADGSALYVGGNFTTVNGLTQRRIVRFDTATGQMSSWKPTGWPNNVVRAIAVAADRVYIGGAFTSLGSATVTRLAALSLTTGAQVPGFSASADGLVRDLVLASNRLWIGGNFSNVNGTSQNKLTAIDPSSGATIAGVYHPSYPILDLAPGSTRLFAAGGGGGGKALAVNLSTGAKVWEKKTDGNVQGVDVSNGTPYFGGHFFKYDGKAVEQMVRADAASGTLDTTWLPPVTSGFLGVFAVDAFGNNKLYVGGDFTRVSNLKRLNFAQFTDGAAPANADLGVVFGGTPGTVNVGQQITFTATVTNAGPDPATSTTLTDVLPTTLDFVSAPGCTYTSGIRTVTCALGTVTSSGASATVVASANAAGSIDNTATVAAATSDANTANNSATATTTVESAGGADLGVTTTVPAKIDQGAGLSYTLTVENHGPNADGDVVLTDVLPSNLTSGGSVTASQGSCSGTSTLICDLGTMASGGSATVTIPGSAPSSPQTLINQASVAGLQTDPVSANDGSVTYVSVIDPAQAGDATAPARQSMHMLDEDRNGFVDSVTVVFNENLATCAAPCTAGWLLTGIPGGGTLQSVTTSGSTATLTIGGWTDQPDTAIGLFTVGLSAPNAIQDAAGNHPSFAASAPLDEAGPVPVGFRKQHPTSGSCSGLPKTSVLEACDELTAEWSEQIAPGSIPSTTTFTVTDPVGPGNDVLTAPGFIQGSMDLGSDGYVTVDGASASWSASTLTLSSARDALTVRVVGSCAGTGCAALAAVGGVTVVYVPASSIRDAAGTTAGGSFQKSQTMF